MHPVNNTQYNEQSQYDYVIDKYEGYTDESTGAQWDWQTRHFYVAMAHNSNECAVHNYCKFKWSSCCAVRCIPAIIVHATTFAHTPMSTGSRVSSIQATQ